LVLISSSTPEQGSDDPWHNGGRAGRTLPGLMRIVVVGLGLIGRQRAQAIVDLAAQAPIDLAATVDPAAAGLEGTQHRATLDELEDDAYDAAVVAVPHDVAAPLAKAVLAQGKPVLLEKPLGVDAETARDIAARAQAVELPSFVGYNYRFLPTMAAAFEAIADGFLGGLRNVDLLIGHGGHPDSAEGWKLRPERAGGGVLLDPGVHLLDLLLCIAPGARCQYADATRGFWGTGIEEDLVAAFAADQLIATVRVSHIRWVNTFRVEIGGEDGYAIIEGRGGTYGPQTVRLGRRWAWREASRVGQRETEVIHDFGIENRSLEDELAAVVAAWTGEALPARNPRPATMPEALRVAELCDAMYGMLER
jgi:1,5-anhydro-D-fructose reductase (1,5-anhydro-D-mannitol-forming)